MHKALRIKLTKKLKKIKNPMLKFNQGLNNKKLLKNKQVFKTTKMVYTSKMFKTKNKKN